MPIKIGRIIALAVVIEALAILLLVAIVAVFGPRESAAAQAYAQRLGYWVGPIAGFALCLGGGWLIGRKLPSHQLLNGLALGTVVAAIDVALLIASGASMQTIFVVSNLGRVIAGSIGGWLAQATTRRSAVDRG